MSDWKPSLLDRLLLAMEGTWLEWRIPAGRMSEARWRAINAEKLREGCPCGSGPAAWVHVEHGTYGKVPSMHFTCVQHPGVNAWRVSGGDGLEPGDDADRLDVQPWVAA